MGRSDGENGGEEKERWRKGATGKPAFESAAGATRRMAIMVTISSFGVQARVGQPSFLRAALLSKKSDEHRKVVSPPSPLALSQGAERG